MDDDIPALAAEKVRLQAKLEAIAIWNTYGQTLETLTDVMVQKIEATYRIEEIDRAIQRHMMQRAAAEDRS